MDGLIPLVFKVLKKKKAMRYYRSLSSSGGPARIDAVAIELAWQLHHSPRALRWHQQGDHSVDHSASPAAATVATTTPRNQKLRVVAMAKASAGSAQRVPVMEALPRETFSPRVRGGGAAAVAPTIVGRSYLGGK